MSARKFLDDRPLHQRLDEPVDRPIPFVLTSNDLPLLGGKPVRAASYAAQEAGDDAEDLVEAQHSSLAFSKLYPNARLLRRYPKRIWRDGRLRVVTPQGPDFSGGIVVDGRALWCEVEVKVVNPTKGERLDLPRFTDAEVTTLSACHAAGGVAVVLILYGEFLANAIWCGCPWSLFESRYRAWSAPRLPGAKAPPGSVPASEILSHAVKHRVQYLQQFLTRKASP